MFYTVFSICFIFSFIMTYATPRVIQRHRSIHAPKAKALPGKRLPPPTKPDYHAIAENEIDIYGETQYNVDSPYLPGLTSVSTYPVSTPSVVPNAASVSSYAYAYGHYACNDCCSLNATYHEPWCPKAKTCHHTQPCRDTTCPGYDPYVWANDRQAERVHTLDTHRIVSTMVNGDHDERSCKLCRKYGYYDPYSYGGYNQEQRSYEDPNSDREG